jgi:hypothetical protein
LSYLIEPETPIHSLIVANRKKQHQDGTVGSPIVELIVRRGALRRFDELKRNTTDLPVKLSWDRRLVERRASSAGVESDHRKTERRKNPPFTWEAADFVAVEVAPADAVE